jgi:hypothetical protein
MSHSRSSILLCLVALIGAGCAKKLDMPRVKAEIKAGIEKQASVQVLWVECPDSRKAKPGDRFECRAGVEGGTVSVDVVQDDYANAQWTQREQLLDARRLEMTIQEGLKVNLRLEAKVTCPFNRPPAVPGTRFVCLAQPAGAVEPFEVPVFIKDAKGQVDWSVPKSVLEEAREHP